jgi:hypothetical protein
MQINPIARQATLGIALIAGVAPIGAASAAETVDVGKIVATQGHQNPTCRMVLLRKSSDQSLKWFRIANSGSNESIFATTLTAVASQLTVAISYDPAITSGCGSEPAISWIEIRAPGS